MANIPLKSIKFPGLSDTYTVPQIDATLTTSGKAADAKVTGDKLVELKSAIALTTGDEDITITIAGNGYIASDLSVNSPTSSWRYSTPIQVKKNKHYIFTTSVAAIVSAITKSESDGTLISSIKMGTEQEIAWKADFDGYVVLCFNISNAYSFIGYYSIADYTALPDFVSQNTSDISEIEAIINNDSLPINIADLTFESNGYVATNGDFVAKTSTSHKIMRVDASHLRYIKYQTVQTINAAFGVLKDANGNTLKIFPLDTTSVHEYDLSPSDGNVLYISFFNFATTPNPYYATFYAKNYETIEEAYDENPVKYHSCVKKPLSFNGKTINFFGDSITYGYIAASGNVEAHQATNQYPKLFAQAVGASYNNYGRTGHTLADTAYGSIYNDLQTYGVSECDFVVVSGGVNDWQTGVTENELKTAMMNICTWLGNNFSGEVIFITPINKAGRNPITTPTQTLQNVRNVITQIALEHGYSVVQGWEFPFPTSKDDPYYISAMFQDRLHPTELGYSLYAQALRNAVC